MPNSSPAEKCLTFINTMLQPPDKKGRGGKPLGERPLVTISRQAGAGGHRLAEALVAEIAGRGGSLWQGWRVFDHELLRLISGDRRLEASRQLITSRILWLRGLEAGVNRGGEVDSFDRYIYIHGTNHEDRLGKPMSAGCVEMRNLDVIELCDEVRTGDLVFITA